MPAEHVVGDVGVNQRVREPVGAVTPVDHEVFDEKRVGYLTVQEFVDVLSQWGPPGEPMDIDEAVGALEHGGIVEGDRVDYRRYAKCVLDAARK